MLALSCRSFQFGNTTRQNGVQCSLLNAFFLLFFYLFCFIISIFFFPWMVTATPLGTDVLLMTPQFSSVHNFYIRVKSLQLESHG